MCPFSVAENIPQERVHLHPGADRGMQVPQGYGGNVEVIQLVHLHRGADRGLRRVTALFALGNQDIFFKCRCLTSPE